MKRLSSADKKETVTFKMEENVTEEGEEYEYEYELDESLNTYNWAELGRDLLM